MAKRFLTCKRNAEQDAKKFNKESKPLKQGFLNVIKTSINKYKAATPKKGRSQTAQ
jgi:hypothetical protein